MRQTTMTNDTTPTDDGTDGKSRLGPGRRTFLGASALVGAGALGAVSTTAADDHDESDDYDEEGDDGMEATATVTFDDQTTDGGAVVVAEATLSAGGFVTIHDSTLLDGEVLGSVIGVSDALEPGDVEDLEVALFGDIPGTDFERGMLEEDEALIAMPHFDSNDSGAYEFVASEGEVDGPYVDEAGDPVVDDGMVTVASDDEMADDEGMDDEMAFSLQDIVDDPEGYYVDNHTAENPDGSIRAQLHGEPGTTEFEVEMTGDAVVEEGTEGATGTAHITLDPEEEVICFDLTFCDITPPYESPALTATHIHEGEAGDTGPPVICFPDPQPRDPEFDGPRTSSGCLPGELAFQTGLE